MAGEAERTDLLPLFGNPRIHRRYQDDYFGPLISSLFADRTAAAVGWISFNAPGTLDGEIVTLGARVYEFDTAAAPGAVTAGNVRVDVSGGAGAAASLAALVLAVNADADREVDAVAATGGGRLAGFVSRTHVGDVAAALVCTTTVVACMISAGGTLRAAETPQEYTGVRGVSIIPLGAGGRLALGDTIPIAAIAATTRPDWLQVQAYNPAVNLLAPRPLPATVTFEWIQANTNRWLLEVADSAATLVDGDEIHWQASVR